MLHKGFDLMILSAGKDVASFGRIVGCKLFSSGSEGNKLISPQRSSDKLRKSVSGELAEQFKGISLLYLIDKVVF